MSFQLGLLLGLAGLAWLVTAAAGVVLYKYRDMPLRNRARVGRVAWLSFVFALALSMVLGLNQSPLYMPTVIAAVGAFAIFVCCQQHVRDEDALA